jgi:hypothetical protein
MMTRTTSEPPHGVLLWATQGTAAAPRALSRTSRSHHAGDPMLLALRGPDKQLGACREPFSLGSWSEHSLLKL